VFEPGHGTLIENILFHPDGSQFFLLGSTVQPENYGEVQLSRSLLKIDPNLSILLVPIPLRPDGFSHGLVLLERDALVISLDTAGREVTGGATLARIDLLQDELTLTRPVGNVPSGVRRRGLAGGDDLDRRVYALLSDQGGGSDFDPPGTTGESGAYLAAIRLDSLTVEARLPLSENWDWFAVVPTALGVLVAGTSTRGTLLIEVDTQWMQESSRLELPEVVSDVVASGEVAVLPSSRGLYEIGLNFLALRRFIPADFQRTGEVAMTSDGSIACVMLEDPLSPGKTALGLVNLEAGGLERIVQ
jgi:hypothetical protein